jgi:hypothetical protein
VKKSLLFVPLISCLLAALAVPQSIPHNTMPTPPPSLDPTPPDQESAHINRRVDLTQLQRDADDLARTAQTIPSDVASVRKGMLPKDVILKLKQIEKLSKHLRGELTP